MASSHIIVILIILCFTFLNFTYWNKSNRGYNTSLLQIYNNLMARNLTENNVDHTLQEIRAQLDEHLKLLQNMDSRIENGDQLFKNMKEFSIKQVPLRKRTLGQIYKKAEFAQLYGALAPEVFCPEKVRVGTVGDGGKWVCNPWKVPSESVLFSLGLNNFIGFETEWQRLLSNRSILFGFDADEQKESTKKVYSEIRGVSRKVMISPVTSASRNRSTIIDLAKDANVSDIEILKIDIEGAEKTCLIPFLEKYTVCQIYLELHGGAQEHLKLLQDIAHLKYRLFSYEINGFTMTACEYSFIHESCVDKYEGKRIANYLDIFS